MLYNDSIINNYSDNNKKLKINNIYTKINITNLQQKDQNSFRKKYNKCLISDSINTLFYM